MKIKKSEDLLGEECPIMSRENLKTGFLLTYDWTIEVSFTAFIKCSLSLVIRIQLADWGGFIKGK